VARPVRLRPGRHRRPPVEQPWYDEKTEPAFEDMLVKLRRVIIAARFSSAVAGQPTNDEIRAVTAAQAAAAA
jgi:hypothetical protein